MFQNNQNQNPIQIENQKKDSTDLQLRTAVFPNQPSPVELSKNTFGIQSNTSPWNEEHYRNLSLTYQDRYRAMTTSRPERFMLNTSQRLVSVDMEASDSKCKKFEIRLIGAQKTIKALQNAQRLKDDEIERLKREVKAKQKIIDSYTAEREKKTRTEEMQRYIKTIERKMEDLKLELDQCRNNNQLLKKDNENLINRVREQDSVITKYKELLNNQMNDLSTKEEYNLQIYNRLERSNKSLKNKFEYLEKELKQTKAKYDELHQKASGFFNVTGELYKSHHKLNSLVNKMALL